MDSLIHAVLLLGYEVSERPGVYCIEEDRPDMNIRGKNNGWRGLKSRDFLDYDGRGSRRGNRTAPIPRLPILTSPARRVYPICQYVPAAMENDAC